MPLGATPSKVVLAARIRHERRRQDKIDLALATANLVLGGFSNKPVDTLNAVQHMFTEDEIQQIKEDRKEREEYAAQAAQIARLRAMFP
jgi:hypothetical protein